MTLRITLVLPHWGHRHSGGVKVHYQYANALAAIGHEVTVLLPVTTASRATPQEWKSHAKSRLNLALTGRPPFSWFTFHPRVKIKLVAALRGSLLPAADVTILTAWQTAALTAEPAPRAGQIVQIVYDYEFWMEDLALRPQLRAAFSRSDVRHIATSSSVATMLCDIGRTPFATVTAGLDDESFGADVAPEARAAVVGFPLRPESLKDMPTAFAAARLICQRRPDAVIQCFGDHTSNDVPGSVDQLGRLANEDLRAFYNRCSVFMLPSRHEGWGLPAAEAMACGAAVVSTRNGGTEDFVTDDVTGLLVAPGEPEAMAAAVCALLDDPARRKRLAQAGTAQAATMTVDASASKLDGVLQTVCHAASWSR